MRDDLVGFVVCALDETEHTEIQQKIDSNELLRRQVQLARQSLRPLEHDSDIVHPPKRLAERTTQMIADYAQDGSPPSPPATGSLSSAPPTDMFSDNRSWTMSDFVVAAGVCVAAACLFFPALVNSRYHAQRLACEKNLGELGTAMAAYSSDNGGYLPAVPTSGKYARAGIYAPKLLAKNGHLSSSSFHCPANARTIVLRIPSLKDIYSAEETQLVKLYETMGGDYAYSLGFVANGQLHRQRDHGSNGRFIPVLADAPHDPYLEVPVSSHGRGQNVLFQDGHVSYLPSRKRPGSKNDDLFLNDDEQLEEGLHAEDAVLAKSDEPRARTFKPSPADEQ